jgi:hypothetical protein
MDVIQLFGLFYCFVSAAEMVLVVEAVMMDVEIIVVSLLSSYFFAAAAMVLATVAADVLSASIHILSQKCIPFWNAFLLFLYYLQIYVIYNNLISFSSIIKFIIVRIIII